MHSRENDVCIVTLSSISTASTLKYILEYSTNPNLRFLKYQAMLCQPSYAGRLFDSSRFELARSLHKTGTKPNRAGRFRFVHDRFYSKCPHENETRIAQTVLNSSRLLDRADYVQTEMSINSNVFQPGLNLFDSAQQAQRLHIGLSNFRPALV